MTSPGPIFQRWDFDIGVRERQYECSLNVAVRSTFVRCSRSIVDWPLYERTIRSKFVLCPITDDAFRSLLETYLGNRTTREEDTADGRGLIIVTDLKHRKKQGTENTVEADGPVRVPDFHGS